MQVFCGLPGLPPGGQAACPDKIFHTIEYTDGVSCCPMVKFDSCLNLRKRVFRIRYGASLFITSASKDRKMRGQGALDPLQGVGQSPTVLP